MSNRRRFTRRAVVRSGANILAAGAALAMLPRLASAAKPITVGFIYVGPRQDFGWNQAHWAACRPSATARQFGVIYQGRISGSS